MSIYAVPTIHCDHFGSDATVPMIHVSLFYAENDGQYDRREGKKMGYIVLYRVPYINDSLIWADGHSALMVDLAEFKNMCCDCSLNNYNNPYYDEECFYYDHYILDKFYINKEFRGQGLAYESLYVGLRESGCTHSFLYLYPNPMTEGEGLTKEQLQRFYKRAVSNHDLIDEYENVNYRGDKETFFRVSYWNYDGSARQGKTMEVFA